MATSVAHFIYRGNTTVNISEETFCLGYYCDPSKLQVTEEISNIKDAKITGTGITSLDGKTVEEMLTLFPGSINANYIIEIKGKVKFYYSTSKLNISLSVGQTKTLEFSGSPGSEPDFRTEALLATDVRIFNTGDLPNSLTLNVGDADYGTYTINKLVLVIKFDLNAGCSGDNLTNQVCIDSCNKDLLDSGNTCLDPHIEFFKITGKDGVTDRRNVPIMYFKDYISKFGKPVSKMDNAIDEYCLRRYGNFFDLTTGGERVQYTVNFTDADFCACHLSSKVYENYLEDLSARLDGLGNLGLDSRCLYSNCASSLFKTQSMFETTDKSRCSQLDCINVVSFNNNGRIDRSKININVKGDCAKLVDKDAPKPGPGPIIDSVWIPAVVGGIILILLILLIFFLVKK
jgi:hypothetical protein